MIYPDLLFNIKYPVFVDKTEVCFSHGAIDNLQSSFSGVPADTMSRGKFVLYTHACMCVRT